MDAGPTPGMPDPGQVRSARQLGEALAALLGVPGARSYRAVEAATEELVSPLDARELTPADRGRFETVSKSAVEAYLKGQRPPKEKALRTLLAVAGLRAEAEQAPWVAAWRWVMSPPRPPGAVLVADADPRLLGVHRAIAADPAANDGTGGGTGGLDAFLPAYVERDKDTAPDGLRGRVAAAARRGGFVLLVGGSSVGKTRSAYEAVRALLEDWWLVHPSKTAGPLDARSLAAAPVGRTVVWLDELQRYLAPDGLSADTVRALLAAEGPVVLVGTLWPRRYEAYRRRPGDGEPDPHAEAREILELADVVTVEATFSGSETARARAAASADTRVARGLAVTGYSLPQALAAAPELVQRWETAQLDPYRRAVLTAAVDATRAGVTAPLTAPLLRAAAVDYCTAPQQHRAPANWFDDALDFATDELHGGAAALEPTGTGMGNVTGYLVADYLQQHTNPARRTKYIPSSTWNAISHHCTDAPSLNAAADMAERATLAGIALLLSQSAVDAGDGNAAAQVLRLMAERGDVDGLRARADTGDSNAASRLALLLADRGDEDGLRARADTGDEWARYWLGRLLDKNSQEDVLRACADTGDSNAASRLTSLLADRGDEDGLRARADTGEERARYWLARLLAQRGDVDGLRVRADPGDSNAASKLADLLAQRGEEGQLRAHADPDRRRAAFVVASIASWWHDEEALRARAEAGDSGVESRLAELLAQRGDVDGLRARADTGDGSAASWLAFLLAQRGDEDGLQARADTGDLPSSAQLAKMLAQRGARAALRTRARAGDPYAAQALDENSIEATSATHRKLRSSRWVR